MEIICRGEELETLSARTGLPVCLLLAAAGGSPPRKGRLRLPEGVCRACLPAAPARSPWQEGEERWRCAPGDTVFEVARRFGSTMAAIVRRNHLPGGELPPGRWIAVPLLRPEFFVYTLRAGESSRQAARRFGVLPEELHAWNGTGGDYPGRQLVLRRPRDGKTARAESPGGRIEEK